MRYACILLSLFLAACGGGTKSDDSRDAAKDESVFDPLIGTVERAEGVEDTLRERAEEERRRIDEAE